MITTSADWSEVKFNGTDIAQVNFNGVKVWEKPASGHIYGVSWSKSTAGTATGYLLTRTDEAANFSNPVPYVKNATTYSSPFDSLMPWAGMVASYADNLSSRRVVAIPKFWYKITEDSSKITIQIADYRANGFIVSPAHRARHGYPEQDIVYIGRYNSYSLEPDTYSKTGQPITRETLSNAANYYTTAGWELMDIDMLTSIQLLYLVEFANWSSIDTIGRGYSYDSWTTGKTDDMPYHTGTTGRSQTSNGYVQYRNIELTGSWIWGCYFYNTWIRLYRDTVSYKSGSIIADDAGTRIGVATTGNNGYSKSMKIINPTTYCNGILLFTDTNTSDYGSSLRMGYRSSATSGNLNTYLYGLDSNLNGGWGGICGNDSVSGNSTQNPFRGMKFGTLP